mmetsp:Transcript_33313/g.106352  ORF Transcript_33313/g.106352 Transcript_33313/m.106352 type:complete len:295 (+) Transcript_33313:66-950(+)
MKLWWWLAPVWVARAQMYVQWGHTRTATTFQFQTVCAAVAMVHGPQTTCRYIQRSTPNVNWTISGPSVIKTHDLSFRDEMRGWTDFAGLYVTETTSRGHGDVRVGDAYATEAKRDESRGANYVQFYEKMFFRKFTIVYDYQKPLGLTNHQTTDLAEYMRYWEILRRCCGTQMSKDFSARLRDDARFRKDTDIAFDTCEAYNISNVEGMLMRSRIYRDFAPTVDVIGRASPYDEPYDGNYCRRTQVATSKCKLGFNDKRTRTLLTMPDQSPFLQDDGDYSTMSTAMLDVCNDHTK